MSSGRGSFREIEYTADLAIEVTASALAGLFITAGEALFALIADPKTIEACDEITVTAAGSGLEELLHALRSSQRRDARVRSGPSTDPAACQEIGQPVLIPGDMGRYSYLLGGTEAAMEKTFGTTCHGAGRLMSRAQAKKQSRGINIDQEMETARCCGSLSRARHHG